MTESEIDNINNLVDLFSLHLRQLLATVEIDSIVNPHALTTFDFESRRNSITISFDALRHPKYCGQCDCGDEHDE